MEVVRHCSERRPGGLRRWRRLARRAGFTGVLEVYGYGVHGGPAKMQLRVVRKDDGRATVADYGGNHIRVWVNAPCSPERMSFTTKPLFAFAHELGHHRQEMRGVRLQMSVEQKERSADRYARRLLRQVP